MEGMQKRSVRERAADWLSITMYGSGVVFWAIVLAIQCNVDIQWRSIFASNAQAQEMQPESTMIPFRDCVAMFEDVKRK